MTFSNVELLRGFCGIAKQFPTETESLSTESCKRLWDRVKICIYFFSRSHVLECVSSAVTELPDGKGNRLYIFRRDIQDCFCPEMTKNETRYQRVVVIPVCAFFQCIFVLRVGIMN